MNINQTDLPALRRLWSEAFGDPDSFVDGFFRTGFSFDRCRCLRENDTPVAVLYWFDCRWQDQKLAYIYAVATAKEFQGRGLCRRLMEDTHRHLRSLGYKGAILVPGSSELFRLYEKLGYTPCCPRQMKSIAASDPAAALTAISAEEYLRLRADLLPADAVWQDEAALRYLDTYAGFYRGDGFAFTGGMEDGTFYFQEFIGDMEQVSKVLPYFHCACGEVPIYTGAPYAMYRSLTGDKILPTYFGLPLN